MSEQPGAPERFTMSATKPPAGGRDAGPDGLTRAQARALSRCAPLTPEEFKTRRQAAEQGMLSLRGLLSERPDQRDAPAR